MLASATTSTASIIPLPKLWVNCQVNHPLLAQSKKTSPQLSKTETTQVENSTPPPSSQLQEKHTSSKGAPTSSIPLPLHNDLNAHPYTPDRSPLPSSRPSAPPSPMSVTWS